MFSFMKPGFKTKNGLILLRSRRQVSDILHIETRLSYDAHGGAFMRRDQWTMHRFGNQ